MLQREESWVHLLHLGPGTSFPPGASWQMPQQLRLHSHWFIRTKVLLSERFSQLSRSSALLHYFTCKTKFSVHFSINPFKGDLPTECLSGKPGISKMITDTLISQIYIIICLKILNRSTVRFNQWNRHTTNTRLDCGIKLNLRISSSKYEFPTFKG